MEQLQRVIAVVNKVDATATWSDSETEETTSARRATRGNRLIQEFVVDLRAARRYLDDSAVIPVDDQDIAIGCNGQSQRVINEAIGTYFISGMSRG